MLKFRNSLVIVVTTLVTAAALLVASEASARTGFHGSKSPRWLSADGSGISSKAGEPDVGGGSKNDPPPSEPNDHDPEFTPGMVLRGPGDLRWVITFWAGRFLGAGW